MKVTQQVLDAMDRVLDAYSRPALVLHRPSPADDYPLGRSRFGGLPTLPSASLWPIGVYADAEGLGGSPLQRVPMAFVAQIDCADIHPHDARFPERGILFFFAALAGGFGVGDPEFRHLPTYNVVYCADVDRDQAECTAPPDLAPVLISMSHDFVLPEETGLTTYPSAPMEVRPIHSWPDFDAIVPGRVDLSPLWHAMGSGILPPVMADVSVEDLAEAYDHRKGWRQMASITNAVEFLDDRSARTVAEYDRYSCTGAFHLVVRSIVTIAARQAGWPHPDRQQLEALEAAGRSWLAHAEPPSDVVVSSEERSAFVSWLDAQRTLGRDASRVVDQGIAAGLAAAPKYGFGYSSRGERPRLGATFGYGAVKANRIGLPRSRQSVRVDNHQMGGWFPCTQDPRPVTDPAVGLLHLISDYGLCFMFGDSGELQFWIDPADLAARRFDRAWATLTGG